MLDPVITVHPDQMFFECFSKDESVHGKLSCGHEVFDEVNEFKCGTTNIDYSEKLYNEFQKIRTYKQTRFEIDPKGFDIETSGEENYREVKIDLPDSWIRETFESVACYDFQENLFRVGSHRHYQFHKCIKREIKKSRDSIKYILKPENPLSLFF